MVFHIPLWVGKKGINHACFMVNCFTCFCQSASSQKTDMEKLKGQAADENVKLEKRKKAIDRELEDVEPLVQAARDAVGNIRNETLSEIRALRAPPDTVRDILEGVLRVMGNNDTSWLAMKRFFNYIYYH